jgi:pyruvate,water dikinase
VPDRRAVPCLTDDEIREVARLARQVERHYGRPQNVEWAVAAGPTGGIRVFLLQSRPETVWSRRAGGRVSTETRTGYANEPRPGRGGRC